MNFQKSGQIVLPFTLSEFVNSPTPGGGAAITASRKVNLNGQYLLKLKGVSLSCNTSLGPLNFTAFGFYNFVFNLRANEIVSYPGPTPGYVFHLDTKTIADGGGMQTFAKAMTSIGNFETTVLTNIQGSLNFQLTCAEGKNGSIVNFQKPDAYFNFTQPITYAFCDNSYTAFYNGSIIFVFEYEKVENSLF